MSCGEFKGVGVSLGEFGLVEFGQVWIRLVAFWSV